MSFISIAAGQPIRATHVQQFTNWLTGSKKDTSGTITTTSASEFTLTLKNESTATSAYGGLRILSATGVDVFKTARNASGEDGIAAGDTGGIVHPTVFFWVNKKMTAHGSVFEASADTNGTNSIDIGASLFVSRVDNTGAVSHARAIEGHHFRLAGSSNGENYIMNLGRHCDVTGPDIYGDCGIRIDNEHTNWSPPITSGTLGGIGVLVQGEDGWQNYFTARNQSNVTVFNVDRTGAILSMGLTTGSVTPVTASTHFLGTASSRFLAVYADNYLIEGGAASAPTFAFRADTQTGFYRPGTGALGVTVLATAAAQFNTTAVQLEKPVAVLKTTSPTTPGSGYSALAPNTDESWRRITSSGASVQMMDASLIARRNRLINGDFQIWQDGTSPTVTSNAYGPDQWRVLMETNTSATISRGSSAVMTTAGHYNCVLTVGAGNNNKFGIFQPIEGVEAWPFRGTVCSLQAKLQVSNTRIENVKMAVLQWASTEDGISATPISAWNGEGTNPSLSTWTYASTPADATSGSLTGSGLTTAALYKVENVSISATATNLGVFIWSDSRSQTAGDTFTVSDVQLELGAVCTQFERRHRTAEESLCYRYYYRMFPGADAKVFGFGQAYSTGSARLYVAVPSQMRTQPTLSVSSLSDFALTTSGFGLTTAPADMSLYSWNSNIATLNVGTGPTNLVIGDCTMLLTGAGGGTTGALKFSARL